jgi:hypothetical protein
LVETVGDGLITRVEEVITYLEASVLMPDFTSAMRFRTAHNDPVAVAVFHERRVVIGPPVAGRRARLG